MTRDLKQTVIVLFLLLLCIAFPLDVMSKNEDSSSLASKQSNRSSTKLVLQKAVICEEIKDLTPKNQSVVFSVSVREIFCFTYFNPVHEDSFIYHNWFYRDGLITRQKLSVKSPQWSTYSSIQLREYDKGPWRVEIKDNNNVTIRVLRFSITD